MNNINEIAASYIENIQRRCELIRPLVVIRCITYNQEEYLKDTLEGFVNQITDFPFVAVVHDDASSDENQKIIKDYARNYPDIIFPILEKDNQFSKGGKFLKDIMDKACDVTGAEFVAFCEGDDYWIDPLKLQKQVDILKANSDISLVHTGFKVRKGNGEFLDSTYFEKYKKISKSGNFFYKILKGNYILTCTTMVKKELFLSEFYVNAPLNLDYLYFIAASLMGKACYIEDNTSVYRRISTGQMLSNLKKVREKGSIVLSYTSLFYLNNKVKNLSFFTKQKLNTYIGARVLKRAIKDPDTKKPVSFNQYPKLIPYLPVSTFYLLSVSLKNKTSMGLKSFLKKVPGINEIKKIRTKFKNSRLNSFQKESNFQGKIIKDIIGKENIIKVGVNCRATNLKIRVRGTGNIIEIGNNVFFGPGNSIWAEGNDNKITIGDNCTFTQNNHLNAQENRTSIVISKDCMISNNVIVRTSDSHPIYDKNTKERLNSPQNVEIGEHVWIAPNVKIMKGARIPSGCIIGSDSTINKGFDIPDSLIAGRPAKIIRSDIEWTREKLF